MKVKEIMTRSPATCTPTTPLQQVAQMMVEHDCGAIPVVDDSSQKVAGIVTDRDITCRTVAKGVNPLDRTAGDCMSSPAHTVRIEDDVEQCCKVMEDHQVRRIAVVDEQGACCGIVAQADVARHSPQGETAEVVSKVSKPTEAASR